MAEAFSSLVDAFKNVGVSRAYGAPVQLDGEELIPVALGLAPVVCAVGLSLRGLMHGRR